MRNRIYRHMKVTVTDVLSVATADKSYHWYMDYAIGLTDYATAMTPILRLENPQSD